MKKQIVAFDVETTGLSFSDDFILQMSASKFDAETFEVLEDFNEYVIPPVENWKIEEGAYAKHGLTKEFILEHGRPLKEVAAEFLEFVGDNDTLSHNGQHFDTRMILKDFKLVGLDFNINRVFFDSYKLEMLLHPRTLETIYESYTGKKFDGAHNAINDVHATIEVFKNQVEIFKQQEKTLDDIKAMEESNIFCIDGMIKKNGEDILFAKGKYKDVEFMEVATKDVSYIKWFMGNNDFSEHTKNTLRKYYSERKQKQ